MKFFKGKNKPKAVPVQTAEPRPAAELRAEFSRLANDAGQCQYQALVYTKRLEQINAQMLRVNQEASQRDKLDAEAAKKVEESKAAANV